MYNYIMNMFKFFHSKIPIRSNLEYSFHVNKIHEKHKNVTS